jgi:hypothetical protein
MKINFGFEKFFKNIFFFDMDLSLKIIIQILVLF